MKGTTRYIYGLYAPGDHLLRYIGQTKDIDRRMFLFGPGRSTNGIVVTWMKRCRLAGIPIRYRILETITSRSPRKCWRLAMEAEETWVYLAEQRNYHLFNWNRWLYGAAPELACQEWSRLNGLLQYPDDPDFCEATQEKCFRDIASIERECPGLKILEPTRRNKELRVYLYPFEDRFDTWKGLRSPFRSRCPPNLLWFIPRYNEIPPRQLVLLPHEHYHRRE